MSQPCEAHKRHYPRNLTVEGHHIIPQAFQHTYPSPLSPDPNAARGKGPDGRPLWDMRLAWLCPTGHRNTHAWIVLMMRAQAAARSDDPAVGYRAVKPRRAPAELAVAYLALTRFTAAGGSLLALTAAGQWGEA